MPFLGTPASWENLPGTTDTTQAASQQPPCAQPDHSDAETAPAPQAKTYTAEATSGAIVPSADAPTSPTSIASGIPDFASNKLTAEEAKTMQSNSDSFLQQRALQNYCASKKRSIDTTTIDDVKADPKGVTHFAWMGLDANDFLASRCALHQTHGRAIKHTPHGLAIWKDLDPRLQLEFKKCWAVTKTFEHTTERRVVKQSHIKTEGDQGVMMNEAQILRELGGKDDPDAVRQQVNWIAMCKEKKGHWAVYNEWTQAMQCLVRVMMPPMALLCTLMPMQGLIMP
jgi:hypothetical protein